ncbi:hypothetical protein NliqN6_5570 [Naganishia liquefaciens]|uniref:Uncharacterized protein n=1 Tax=Naganishia liquefaciens TaxID=104408 RepID=A0A8H3YHA7_9TREE|nr:hypothetical protein NliqN6_5570 [Naganishia liquefaciens]
MATPTTAPACTGNPSSCEFCNPAANSGACAVQGIPGCTSAPGSCEVCKSGNGCAKDCAGDPTKCKVCQGSCLKPSDASFGVEPARA